MKRLSRRGAAALALALALTPALGQDMLRGVDLTLPAYSRSDYSRQEIVALLKAQKPDAPLDLS
ncbi:MAG TPA: pentapeptide repeat-containing protein, partial [Methylocystis sp.]